MRHWRIVRCRGRRRAIGCSYRSGRSGRRLNRRSDRLGLKGPTTCSRGARLAPIQEDRRGAREAHRERPEPTATTPEPTGLDEVDPREYLRAAHPFGWAPAVQQAALGAPRVVSRWPGSTRLYSRRLYRWRLLILRRWLVWRGSDHIERLAVGCDRRPPRFQAGTDPRRRSGTHAVPVRGGQGREVRVQRRMRQRVAAVRHEQCPASRDRRDRCPARNEHPRRRRYAGDLPWSLALLLRRRQPAGGRRGAGVDPVRRQVVRRGVERQQERHRLMEVNAYEPVRSHPLTL